MLVLPSGSYHFGPDQPYDPYVCVDGGDVPTRCASKAIAMSLCKIKVIASTSTSYAHIILQVANG